MLACNDHSPPGNLIPQRPVNLQISGRKRVSEKPFTDKKRSIVVLTKRRESVLVRRGDFRNGIAGPNEEKKEESMKKQVLRLAAGLLLSVVFASASYAQGRPISVDIPFARSRSEARCSLPGNTTFRRLPSHGNDVQLIQRKSGEPYAIVITMPVDAKSGESKPRLVFNEYGDMYFLSPVWTSQHQGRQLHTSQREKEMARMETRTELALYGH